LPENRVRHLEFSCVMMACMDRLDHFVKRADPVDVVDLLDEVIAILDHLTEAIGKATKWE